jgi:site-specific recombinase XerD
MSRKLTVLGNTGPGPKLLALVVGAGNGAALRFLEFFTVNIRNPNTRAAYGRAAGAFLCWCEGHGITSLAEVLPVHVAAYVEQLQGRLAYPTVKQHLACIRLLFDLQVTGQVVPSNPAHSVRRPRFSVSEGVTLVLSSEETSVLLACMEVSIVIGLRDWAMIAVMAYSFARMAGHSNAEKIGLYDWRNDEISVGELEKIGI